MKSFNEKYFDNKPFEKLKTTITPTEGWTKEGILNHLSLIDVPIECKDVYEIGAGCGRLLKILNEKGFNVYGCDASEDMVKNSREYLGMKRVSLCSGNGELPERDNQFDFVFCFITFQHIPNKETVKKYISETKRILRKGGRFHFQILSKGMKNDGVLWNVHDLKELKKQWINSGFKEISIREYPKWTIVKLKNE